MKDKQTILIVDDNESNIDVLLGILEEYDVIPSLDGKTALSIIEDENIDLILLDIMMPVMDGYEVCKILKNNIKTSKIPIIFLSAKYEMDDIKKGFKLGAVDYITKPFNPIELLVRINTHLELRGYQKNLEVKINDEIEKNSLVEQIMFQKTKQAEIGELLMHIAHQWKQPLSELGSINMYNTAILKNGDNITNEDLLKSFDNSSDILKFMSNTVETFRTFYKPNMQSEYFYVCDAIDIAKNIVSATYDYENIKLNINKKENPKVYGIKNEYSQVILAILNNAKDIFKIRDIKNRMINITIDIKNDKSITTISDNAEGISKREAEDIFLPFVSQKDGLGMGLYMSKTIIEKNNGKIGVENTTDGAEFTIIW